MNKLLMALMLALTLAAAGCGTSEDSDDVNQARIYTDYELFYNANEDVTHAIARFRFGGPFGTILELTGSSGAGVTFNGQPLAYSGFWGGHHREYAGNVTGGTQAWVDLNDGGVESGKRSLLPEQHVGHLQRDRRGQDPGRCAG